MSVDNDIPNGWVETTLGEVAIINPREFLKKGESAINIPMAHLDSFSKKIQTFEKKEFKGGTKFRNGDTLLARITPCLENGKTSYVDVLEENEVGFGSTEYIVIREKENISDKHFLFYLSISPKFRELAIKLMTGTSGRQRVQTNSLIQRKLFFPPLQEQTAIAKILTAFDDKIELLQAQNKTLETTAQTIFKEWFGKYQIGDELPDGWRMYKFIELVKQIKPGTNYQPKRIKEGIPFINGRNIKNGIITTDSLKFISVDEYRRVHKIWQPEENDILITRIGTLGNVGVVRKNDLPMALHYNSINIKEKILNHQFIYFLLKSDFFQKKYHLNKKQSVQEFVTIEAVENITINLPKKIDDEVFCSIFSKIIRNKNQIQALKQTRDTLLPKLMSGALRVNEFKENAV